MPYQLTNEQSDELERLPSPSKRLRYLQDTLGMTQLQAVEVLFDWINRPVVEPSATGTSAMVDRLIEPGAVQSLVAPERTVVYDESLD